MSFHKGGDVCRNLTNDSVAVTVYSDAFSVSLGTTFSIQLVWTQTTATYGAVVSLWASNVRGADPASDADWVQMTADHGFDGFVELTAGAMETSGFGWKDIGNSGAAQYKLKFVRSAGAATIRAHVTMKDTK